MRNPTNTTRGWMPPRGGGYRPGKNTATIAPPAGAVPPGPPPKGPAGASKAAGHNADRGRTLPGRVAARTD